MQSPTPVNPPRTIAARLRFLITPRWVILQAVVVLFVLACYFILAPWQFHRSAQHDAEMAQVAAAAAQPASPIDQVLSTERQPPESATWRTVSATGRFLAEDVAYIRLRQDPQGQPAFEVVVPFETATGTVLVDRGYVPFRAVQEQSAPLPELPSGEVTITGRVQPDQVDPKDRPPSTTPDGRTAYIAASSTILSTRGFDGPVYRGFLALVPDSPGTIEAIPVPVSDDSRPFYSYAIQWLSFGAIAVAGLAYFIYREYRDPVGGSIYLDDDSSSEEPDRTAAPEPESRAGRKARFDKTALYDE